MDLRVTVSRLLDSVAERSSRKSGPVAYGYRRVSTGKQVKSGLGLSDQRDMIEATSERLGLPLWRVRTDGGRSGELPIQERPGLLLILKHIRRDDALIVAKRDRLARDDVEIKLLERALAKAGVRVRSAAGEGTDGDLEDPGLALQRDIHDVFAAHELRVIRARTKAALREKRRRGELAGAVPFGFDVLDDGSLIENTKEKAALTKALIWRRRGLSYRAIAARLNCLVKPKRGAAWYASSVRSVLLTYERTVQSEKEDGRK